MQAVITWLKSIIEGITVVIKMGLWMMQGIANMGAIAIGSVNILGEVMEILPAVVCSSIMSACAILVVLRILGR